MLIIYYNASVAWGLTGPASVIGEIAWFVCVVWSIYTLLAYLQRSHLSSPLPQPIHKLYTFESSKAQIWHSTNWCSLFVFDFVTPAKGVGSQGTYCWNDI